MSLLFSNIFDFKYGIQYKQVHINYYTNTSHDDNWCVGVAAFNPVGIDVTHIKPQNNLHLLVKKACDNDEWESNYGKLQDDESLLTVFYRLWSHKEAILKAVGTGIRSMSDLRNVQFDLSTDLTSFSTKLRPTSMLSQFPWTFDEHRIDNDHRIVVAVNSLFSNCSDRKITHLNISDLVKQCSKMALLEYHEDNS
ncbi:hypothetical protein GJ496_000128 [Pomphorhynchus laevis]|nr:hypothetical protein GJ496_000128 [Pomphorhynchus laevis]